MVAPRTALRGDLGFLRRRVKPRAAVSAAPPMGGHPVRGRESTPPTAETRPPMGGHPVRGRADAPSSPAAAPAMGGHPVRGRSAAPEAAAAPRTPSPAAESRPADRPVSSGLSLGGPVHPAPSKRRSRPTGPAPFPAPGAGDTRELDAETPLVRLDRRRSAVGSLLVTGAQMLAWEAVDGVTGAVTSSGDRQGTEVRTAGNRPLVGYDEGVALVTLRHVRSLRRGLAVGRGVDALGLRLYDGTTLSVPATQRGGAVALSLLVVDGCLELRAEPIPSDWDDATIHREFGFAMTHRFAFPSESP